MTPRSLASPALAILLALLSLGAMAPPAARAAAADRYLDTRILVLGGARSAAGAIVEFGINVSHGAPYVDLRAWPAGADPEVDPPILVQDTSVEPTVQLDGRRLTIHLELLEHGDGGGEGLAPGDPAGIATIEATLAANGEIVVIDESDRLGNRRTRLSGWQQDILASGTVTLPDGSNFAFDDLAGSLAMVDTFRTNADSFVEDARFTDLELVVEGPDAVVIVAGIFGDIGFGWVQVARLPVDPDEPALIGVVPLADLDPLALDLVVPLATPDGEPAGDARVHLGFTPSGERDILFARSADGTRRTVEEALVGSGTVAFPGHEPLAVDAIPATLVEVRVRAASPDGGRPGGEAPANDLPDGALGLEPGAVLRNVWTGGTRRDGEIVDDMHLLLGHSLWYSVRGTGGPITFDPAGSDFDTRLVVLTRVDGVLVPIGMSDDRVAGRTLASLDLQAPLTFDTEPGVEYLVQVGSPGRADGEPGEPEHGRLFQAVRSGD